MLIEIPVRYTGPAATPERIAQFEKAVEETWTGWFGKYEVTTCVVEEEGADNRVKFLDRTGKRSRALGTSFATIFTETNPDHQPLVDAHEGGHFMGAIDRYSKRTDKPKPGWEGNLMAQLDGKVSEATINEILRRNRVRPLDTKEEAKPK